MKIFWMLKNPDFFPLKSVIMRAEEAGKAGRLRLYLVNSPTCFSVIKGIIVPVFDFVPIDFHVPVYYVVTEV